MEAEYKVAENSITEVFGDLFTQFSRKYHTHGSHAFSNKYKVNLYKKKGDSRWYSDFSCIKYTGRAIADNPVTSLKEAVLSYYRKQEEYFLEINEERSQSIEMAKNRFAKEFIDIFYENLDKVKIPTPNEDLYDRAMVFGGEYHE